MCPLKRGNSSGSTKSSLSLALLILSLAVRGRVDYVLFPLVPRASDSGGIASTVCLVRLRRSRRLAQLEHYSNTLARRTVEYFHVQQFSCLDKGARDRYIIIIYMENLIDFTAQAE